MIRMTTVAIGCALAVLGVLGLIPAFHDPWSGDAPQLDVRNARGFTFGIIPNNLVIALFHLFYGLAGIFAFAVRRWSTGYLRVTSVAVGALAVLGVMPPTSTLFGTMPLFGVNMWVHIVVAVVAAWIGWPLPPEAAEEIDWETPASTVTPGVTSVAAIAGRPVHPLLVPFPIAFITGALVTDLSYWWTTLPWYNGYESFWPRASLWLIAAGLTTGVIAALVGAIDYAGVRGLRSIPVSRSHVLSASALLVLTGINMSLRFGDPTSHILPWGISISAVSAILVGTAVWHGTSLTYRHRIGVRGYGWVRRVELPVEPAATGAQDDDAA
jgi:uncharacterized membrane protein